jgi:DNA-directed RNA polymerase sigma subunit (sigma70/sigma32)
MHNEESPLRAYEILVGKVADDLADPWFGEQLARYRAGDKAAMRLISERCLRRVLEIAKKHWRPSHQMSVLDVVQEGNAALVQVIKEYRGTTADDFLRDMSSAVENHIQRLLENNLGTN